MRHVEKSLWIAAMPTITFGEIEHNATGCTLDLISGLGAMRAKLHDHGTQSPNQIQCDVICNQHVFLLGLYL
jgi:hypothetical protein